MTGGVWIASYVLLWLAVAALGLTVLALLRQIGVLHARLRPLGVHPAGEGLDIGTEAPALAGHRYQDHALTLIAFTSPTCEICKDLVPGLRSLATQYDEVSLIQVDHSPDTAVTFGAFDVHSTPYLTAVDRSGEVKGRGVANSAEQAEVLVAAALGGVDSVGVL